jgi:hypothetical protein
MKSSLCLACVALMGPLAIVSGASAAVNATVSPIPWIDPFGPMDSTSITGGVYYPSTSPKTFSATHSGPVGGTGNATSSITASLSAIDQGDSSGTKWWRRVVETITVQSSWDGITPAAASVPFYMFNANWRVEWQNWSASGAMPLSYNKSTVFTADAGNTGLAASANSSMYGTVLSGARTYKIDGDLQSGVRTSEEFSSNTTTSMTGLSESGLLYFYTQLAIVPGASSGHASFTIENTYTFCVGGLAVPAPGAAALLGAAGLLGRRRRA